jgi:hypothetical protein
MKAKSNNKKGDEASNEKSIYETEWQDMPEFVQNKKEPYAKIIVRFDNEADLQEFAKLINQKLTKKTKSIWHPFKSHWGNNTKIYTNES